MGASYLKLTFSEITNMEIGAMTPLIQSYSATYNIKLDETFFTKTPVKSMRDHLLTNVLQLHSYYTASVLNESIPISYVENMDEIAAYNEYYLAFHSENLQFHDIIIIKPQDVKQRLYDKHQKLIADLD